MGTHPIFESDFDCLTEHSMGRDGLVFVNVRKDIVKLKKEKNLAEAPFKEHGAGTSIRWSHCCVTAGPLDRPVFCELGKLYNKDSVIELLLDRKRAQLAAEAEEKSRSKKKKKKRRGKLVLKGNEIPTETHRACNHIRDMKDIKELRIKINPHFKKHVPFNTAALGKSNGSASEQGFTKHAKFQCPITSADFNGSKPFFGNWKCGHTISESVLKELSRDSMKCPVCSLDYDTRDLIRINPIHPDHRKAARELFEKRRKRAAMKLKLQRNMKKEMKQRKQEDMKKEIKREESDSDSDDPNDSSDVDTDSDSTSSCSSDDSEFERLKSTLVKKVQARYASRSRSSSPVVIIPKKENTKPPVKSDKTGDIVVLDSDDDENDEDDAETRFARGRMEARMRSEIEHRRLEEFEDIIRRSKTPPMAHCKKRRKKTTSDPVPIVLSD